MSETGLVGRLLLLEVGLPLLYEESEGGMSFLAVGNLQRCLGVLGEDRWEGAAKLVVGGGVRGL